MSMSNGSVDVGRRLKELQERIARAAIRSGRRPEDVCLIGVSKGQPLERVVSALDHGLVRLGENYVQEARKRRAQIEACRQYPDLRWLAIGHLQSNKAKDVVELFDGVESIDRFTLAEALDRRLRAVGRVLDVLIQVNLSAEPQKSGVGERNVGALVAQCAALSGLRVRGLMTIPAASPNPEANRPVFARLRELRDALRREQGGELLTELSMGMSHDYEVAIEEGATRVRVGTALFGAR